MKNPKNKRTIILLVILLGLVVVAYRVIFAPPADLLVEDNIASSQVVEGILNQVENIRLDVSVAKDPKINSLRSIETPLPSFPIGKKDPFSGL